MIDWIKCRLCKKCVSNGKKSVTYRQTDRLTETVIYRLLKIILFTMEMRAFLPYCFLSIMLSSPLTTYFSRVGDTIRRATRRSTFPSPTLAQTPAGPVKSIGRGQLIHRYALDLSCSLFNQLMLILWLGLSLIMYVSVYDVLFFTV